MSAVTFWVLLGFVKRILHHVIAPVRVLSASGRLERQHLVNLTAIRATHY